MWLSCYYKMSLLIELPSYIAFTFLHGKIFLTSLLSLCLVGLENCKFSLNKPQGLQYTLLFLWDSGNFFEALGICFEESILKRLQKASVLVSWQRSALILWQWRNCQFSVIGWERVFLLNAFFGHCAIIESRCCEHIFSTCQVYQRQKTSGWQSIRMGFDGAANFSGKKMVFKLD